MGKTRQQPAQPDPYPAHDGHRPLPAMYNVGPDTVRTYYVSSVEDDGLWRSSVSFEGNARQIWQAVIAGFLTGHARWAELPDGRILCGLDARGNRITPDLVGNLESVRAYWREGQ